MIQQSQEMFQEVCCSSPVTEDDGVGLAVGWGEEEDVEVFLLVDYVG